MLNIEKIRLKKKVKFFFYNLTKFKIKEIKILLKKLNINKIKQKNKTNFIKYKINKKIYFLKQQLNIKKQQIYI